MKKPTVNTKCVADNYSMPSEKIIEISFPDGTGCLISLWVAEDRGGNLVNRVDVYRIDKGIDVVVGKSE